MRRFVHARSSVPRRLCLVVVTAVLAGCSGEPTPLEVTLREPSFTAPATADPAPLGVAELHNTSIAFPRDGNGQHVNESFEVPQGVRQLLARTEITYDCPVGYRDGARIVLTAPDGNQTPLRGLPRDGYYAVCFGEPSPWEETPLAPLVGAWRLRTEGNLTACVRVVVAANPQGPPPETLGGC